MKRLFYVFIMCMSVLAVNAQVVEKTFADLKNEGNAAIKIKDYPKALDLYEQALVKWGDKPVADTSMIYNMGICAISAKNYEKALKYFDQAILMNYKKVNSLLYKAEVYRLTKNDAESLKTLQTALTISPEDVKVKGKLASYYVKEATVFYSKGSEIMTKVNEQITAGKLKTGEEQKLAEKQAVEAFKKALPLVEKALGYDANNATAKQLKSACEAAIKG
ncbi:MAG: tetratricopeptide repeat protein [Bacteroidia bacterium]